MLPIAVPNPLDHAEAMLAFFVNIQRDEDEDNATELTIQDMALLSMAFSLYSIAQDLKSIKRLGAAQRMEPGPCGPIPL